MRNKQLQERLVEILEELKKLPDNTLVVHAWRDNLIEMDSLRMMFINQQGLIASEGEQVDCILFST